MLSGMSRQNFLVPVNEDQLIQEVRHLAGHCSSLEVLYHRILIQGLVDLDVLERIVRDYPINEPPFTARMMERLKLTYPTK